MSKNIKSKTVKGEKFDAGKVVVNAIIEGLRNGEAMWVKPWVNGIAPENAVTHDAYRGVNAFVLNYICKVYKYDVARFLTFKQCKDLGGHVKKGERSHMVVWNSPYHPILKDKDGNVVKDENGKPKHDPKKTIFLMRYFNVFNVAQCEGLPAKFYEVKTFAHNTVAEAEEIVNGFKDKPEIFYEGCSAYYRLNDDTVHVPKMKFFPKVDEFYSTLFHELAHSTGAAKRCKRDMSGDFGDDSYSFEELVAEISAAILCNKCGIEKTLKNSTAYISGWLKAFTTDKNLSEKRVLSAFSKAEYAVNYILGKKRVADKGGAKVAADVKTDREGEMKKAA